MAYDKGELLKFRVYDTRYWSECFMFEYTIYNKS